MSPDHILAMLSYTLYPVGRATSPEAKMRLSILNLLGARSGFT
jgi:hypothetical protein